MAGGWIETYTGKKFYPLCPRAEDIDIQDIAHSLAMTCRFNGHSRSFYCPTEDQRVLTSDLVWKTAGDLLVGQKLIGFDEYPTEPGATGKKRRRFRPCYIKTIVPVKRKVYRLEMSDGSTVCCSGEHPWLVATKISRNQTWKTTEQLKSSLENGNKRYLHKFMEPWKVRVCRDSGYLAGMFDGEGYISCKNRGGCQLGVSQKEGSTLALIEEMLKQFGFNYSKSTTGSANYGTKTLQIKDGWRGIFRVLGEIQPQRLVGKFQTFLENGDFNKQLQLRGDTLLAINNIYDEGEQWVVGMETSTHTYICEGFGAHNSVAQHSCIVHDLCTQELKLAGLLHDASEAYLGDLVSPIKGSCYFASGVRELEDGDEEYHGAEFSYHEDLILAQVNNSGVAPIASVLYTHEEELKFWDRTALFYEQKYLMPNKQAWENNIPTQKQLDIIKTLPPLDPWTWEKSERQFLKRYYKLMDA